MSLFPIQKGIGQHYRRILKYDFQNYVATFEDIGLARLANIISKDDFKTAYGGRYGQLLKSRAMASFKVSTGYEDWHFKNLDILK
jgi:hypothetical protein